MLQKWDQGGCHRYHLLWRHIHVINFFPGLECGLTLVTRNYQAIYKAALLIQRSTGLGNDKVTLIDGREVIDFISYLVLDHFAIGTFQEAVMIGPGVCSQ